MPEGIGYSQEEIDAGLAPEGAAVDVDELGVAIEPEMMSEGEGELPEEEIPEENLTEPQPDTGATSGIPLSGEDIPELLELDIGDTITFQIDDRAEDGTFVLSVAAEVPPPVEAGPPAGIGPVEADIAASLI